MSTSRVHPSTTDQRLRLGEQDLLLGSRHAIISATIATATAIVITASVASEYVNTADNCSAHIAALLNDARKELGNTATCRFVGRNATVTRATTSIATVTVTIVALDTFDNSI